MADDNPLSKINYLRSRPVDCRFRTVDNNTNDNGNMMTEDYKSLKQLIHGIIIKSSVSVLDIYTFLFVST